MRVAAFRDFATPASTRAHVLVVDDRVCTLARALRPALVRHDVEFARDAFDAIYRIDCATRPHDLIFCDLTRGDMPGPELWAYLSMTRKSAAERMVFLASTPLCSETEAFLARVPNLCVLLPVGRAGFDALAVRRSRKARCAWRLRSTSLKGDES